MMEPYTAHKREEEAARRWENERERERENLLLHAISFSLFCSVVFKRQKGEEEEGREGDYIIRWREEGIPGSQTIFSRCLPDCR